jgi:chromosome segregation ATPase
LAAVATNLSTLQTQLDQLKATIKTLTDQRSAQLAQSDDLNQASEKAKGDKSLDLFKQGATARKSADELSVQIDENNVKLARVQTDFDVAQGQQAMLNAAVKDLTGKADQSTGAWKTVQQQIESQKAQAKALVGEPGQTANPDDPTGGMTLVSKLATLNKKLENERALREEAETHLNNATDRFKEAAQLAVTLQSKLQLQITDPKNQTRAEAEAWKDQASTMHPARYQLQEARALDRRAALAAGRAADANAVSQLAQNLKPILDQLQVALPAPLNDSDNKIAGDIKTGRQLADESYDAANELLAGIGEGSASEDQKNGARISSIFTQYGWYLLSSSANDPKAATAHLEEAKAQRDAVIENGFDPKLLPLELAVTPKPAPPK